MKLFSALFALILFVNAQAQWTPNTAVNTLAATSNSGDMKAVGTSDGKTYIVFWKVVPAPTNYELRLQVLDENGIGTLGPDGALISDAVPMSTFTYIWNMNIDANDNLYVGVTGSGGGEPAYAFKMNTAGTQLWGPNGVVAGSGFSVTILPLSTGDAIVAWFSSGSGTVEMQRYDANGNAIWSSTQFVIQGTNDTSPADLYELANGDYILIFHSLGFGISSTLYAQRCDADGISQWSLPTQLSNKTTQFNIPYSGAVEGDVVYYGYKAASGSRFDSFVQRINADGTLPWGINGMDFDTNQTDYEMNTQIALESSSQYVWAVCTYTNSAQSQKGEYVQKFDKVSGARQFTDNGKMICQISAEDSIHAGNLFLINDQPSFLLKTGPDNGATPTELGIVQLDPNGDPIFPDKVIPMATFSSNKSRIHCTAPANMQQVAVFIEDKGSGEKVYAQNYAEGTVSMSLLNQDTDLVKFNNPIREELILTANSSVVSITVYDLSGRIIYSKKDFSNKQLRIDARCWRAGMYLIKVETTNGRAVSLKTIKQ